MTKQNKTFTREECEKFVDAANPHKWLLSAESLHGQALSLWRNRGREQLTVTRDGHSTLTWDMTNKATFLLAAFAMENMIKAFLVYEFPDYVSDGCLKGITSHDLPALADKSSLVPYKARDRWVFEAFAEGNESWMRYPCGRTADDVQFEQQFSANLWVKYCAMMNLYAVKLKKLLAKGWTGPCGHYGKWTFGEFQR